MNTKHTYSKGAAMGSVIAWVIIGVLILLAIFFFMNRTNVDNDLGTNNVNDALTEQDDQTVEQIEENTANYVGQTITAQGEVASRLGTNVFELATTDLFENDVIVISRDPLPVEITEDVNDVVDEEEIVTVTGTVRQMSIVEVERELGLDLDPEIEVEFEEREPVIVATSVTVQSENTVNQ